MYGRMRIGIMGTPSIGAQYNGASGAGAGMDRFQADGLDPLGDINAINTSIYMGSPGPGMSRIAHGRGKLGPSAYI